MADAEMDTLKLSDLPSETIEKIKTYRWDRFIEKHEGPETWESVLRFRELEFMEIEGYQVLLPIPRDRHSNVTILRCVPSDDDQMLTLFLGSLGFRMTLAVDDSPRPTYGDCRPL